MTNATHYRTNHQTRLKQNEQEQGNGNITRNGLAKPMHVQQNSAPPSRPSPANASTVFDICCVWIPSTLLIFGGCCSNVYTLEALINASPSSGQLITAFQFLLTALITLPNNISLNRGWRNLYLRPRSIPITKWVIYTAFFLTINMLNNTAFYYKISVPLHIILRSAGPVATMAIGRIVGGRRYPPQRIVAVLLLFIGVVCAAISDSQSKRRQHTSGTKLFTTSDSSQRTEHTSTYLQQLPGFVLLSLALLLSALQGLYTDNMYSQHGRSTHVATENLFYCHIMSLPFFLMRVRNLTADLKVLLINITPSPMLSQFFSPISTATGSSLMSPSTQTTLILLLLNAGTQYLCIAGVNRLSAQSSSLTVAIVLNVRKLVSLLLSIWLFGNRLPTGVLTGAAIVFIGGALYALPTGEGRKGRIKNEKKEL